MALVEVMFELNTYLRCVCLYVAVRIPTVKLKIPGKSIFEIRIPNFCYIQVIVFDLSYPPVAAVGTPNLGVSKYATIKILKRFLYFSHFFHGSVLAKSQPLPLVDS